MSKTKRKVKENYWDEETPVRKPVESKKNKRLDRALKTKDVSVFLEEDDDYDYETYW